MLRAYYAASRCLSVHPSVRQSHAVILSKRLNISSKFFTIGYSQTILVSKFNIPTGTPLTAASNNARVYEKIAIFDLYLALSCI